MCLRVYIFVHLLLYQHVYKYVVIVYENVYNQSEFVYKFTNLFQISIYH